MIERELQLQLTKIIQFSPITQPMAIAIVQRTCNVPKMEFDCYANKPNNCNIYGINPDVPCWYVYAPWNDGILALRSSRVVDIKSDWRDSL